MVIATAPPTDLKAFHDLYVHTAERDHFTPRPLAYFQTMFDALGAEDPDRITLYLAHHEGDLVAATIAVRVGTHAWYSYGASSTDKRDVRGSNAVQWAMIRDAIAAGRRGLRPARHHRHPRRRRPPRRADPVQGRHRRRGRRVRRRVGPAPQPRALQGLRALPEPTALTADPGAADEPHEPDPDRRRRPLARSTSARSPTPTPAWSPVAKGNGYGFGLGRLARKAEWLGVDTLAVGTYEELPEVAQRFAGDLLVLTPWRPTGQVPLEDLPPGRVIHTVSRLDDLVALLDREPARPDRARAADLDAPPRHVRARSSGRPPSCSDAGGARLEGVAFHLPLAAGSPPAPRSSTWSTTSSPPSSPTRTLWVSHLTAGRARLAPHVVRRLRRCAPGSAPTCGSATATRSA